MDIDSRVLAPERQVARTASGSYVYRVSDDEARTMRLARSSRKVTVDHGIAFEVSISGHLAILVQSGIGSDLQFHVIHNPMDCPICLQFMAHFMTKGGLLEVV